MTFEIATLVAALVAAGFSIYSTILTARHQSELERWKWDRSQEEERALARRTAIADLGRQLAVSYQAISWLTWKAEHAPSALTPGEVASYDEEMKKLLPAVVGAHLLVVAMDRSADKRLHPMVKQLYGLDAKVARATAHLGDRREESISMLRELYTSAEQYLNELHAEFADLMYPPTAPQACGKVAVEREAPEPKTRIGDVS